MERPAAPDTDRRTLPWLVQVLAVVLVVSACAANPSLPAATDDPGGTTSPAADRTAGVDLPGGPYTSVSPEQLARMLESKDVVLVNVHVPYAGEIEGTDAFLPYDEVATRSTELSAAKEARIVVYCRSGSMSSAAAQTLVGLGYTNVWDLTGGMRAWEQAGHPLITDRRG